MTQTSSRPRVAVIGGGISGLTAAHVLQRTHDVVVWEAADRLGGHADTHDVRLADGSVIPVDTGFIVHNDRTYPVLGMLFRELDVPVTDTEMSMSISCGGCGLSYVGGRGAKGIFAQRRRIADPRFLRMLAEVPRFHKAARQILADEQEGDDDSMTLVEFLREHDFSDYFVQHFAIPLVSCVWSSGHGDALTYPARHLFTFLAHHGMLSVKGSPTWRTVVGGSRVYVDKVAAGLADVRLSSPVASVARHEDGVELTTHDGRVEHFDQVVLATHADIAAAILVDATPEEKEALVAFDYSQNPTTLHTDSSLLPTRAARGSWNFAMDGCDTSSDRVRVSYWMNRLHGYDVREDLVVTLNAEQDVAPERVLDRMDYAHPVFTPETVRAAAYLREAGGTRLAFAGAHLGWGFHEDGARSGLQAAQRLGGDWS